ncbi:lipid transfer [Olea europaea subsp. europaea]|uniref:Non-specific lipid-transfer protein n=1 Tax=Olea europaea subsp. europaea TaxID=158383 RepID=A0A8S0UZ86_OLEEU|nr:lipid transfer [Olea europaea subsp. europaea]
MASSRVVKAMCLVLIAVFLPAPLAEAAITCGTVVSSLGPCLSYVQGNSPIVPAGCCKGINSLYVSAKTTPDRQSVCSCLKSLAGTYKGIDIGKAGGLPGKCGVNIPYKIAPSTDCSKVQ